MAVASCRLGAVGELEPLEVGGKVRFRSSATERDGVGREMSWIIKK